MVDNVTADPGSGGATFATDDDGTAHHPYVKIEFGADNTQTKVSTSDPLPIDLRASNATVTVDLGANNDVTIDNSSIVKAEDAVHSTGDSGVMALVVRNDTLAALAGTDGDYAPLQVNASGALYIQEGAALDVSAATVTVDLGANNDVTIDNSSIVKAEDSVHSTGDAGVMSLAVRNDTLAALAGTDGDYAPLQVNASGALYIQEGSALDVSAATVTVDLGANNDVTIDNSSIVHAEDAVHSTGDAGIMPLAVRNDTLAALAGTDGDYAPLQVNATGALYVDVESGAVSGIADDAAFTVGTTEGVAFFGLFDDTTPDSVDEDDAGIVRMSANRNLYTQIRDAAGNERGANVNASNALLVQEGAAMDVSAATVTVTDDGSFTLAANSGVDIGDVDVTSISAGSNLIGDVGLSGARTSGGTTLYKNIDVDETEDEIKGSAGQVYWIHAMNLANATRYLKFYNDTAANVTVGTTTPDLTFPLATQGDTNGAGFTISIPNGIAFGTAITVAATTGIGDADSGAPGANEITVMLGYA